MSISNRVSIAWPPEPAGEPTSTRVLTSPGRHFVDTRFRRPLTVPSHNPHPSKLQWAFAGTSSSEPIAPGVTHCVWTHTIDSRTSNAAGVKDEGDCREQDDGTTLETGRMINPDTYVEGDYEEVWRDEEVLPAGDGEGEGKGARCVVLKRESINGEEGDGIVVLLGRHCQGILRMPGGRVRVERWWWRRPKVDGVEVTDQGGAWIRVIAWGYRDIEEPLPCEKLCVNEQDGPGPLPAVGDEIADGDGRKWTVVEACLV